MHSTTFALCTEKNQQTKSNFSSLFSQSIIWQKPDILRGNVSISLNVYARRTNIIFHIVVYLIFFLQFRGLFSFTNAVWNFFPQLMLVL